MVGVVLCWVGLSIILELLILRLWICLVNKKCWFFVVIKIGFWLVIDCESLVRVFWIIDWLE